MCYQPRRERLSANLELTTLRRCSSLRSRFDEGLRGQPRRQQLKNDTEECIEPVAGLSAA